MSEVWNINESFIDQLNALNSDGQENINDNLALGFEQFVELFYLKKCRHMYGFLLLCGLNVQSNNCVLFTK